MTNDSITILSLQKESLPGFFYFLLPIAAFGLLFVFRFLFRFGSTLLRPNMMSRGSIKFWAQKSALTFVEKPTSSMFIERFNASPRKDFFGAPAVMSMRDIRSFITGSHNGKKVWVYEFVGEPMAMWHIGSIRPRIDGGVIGMYGLPVRFGESNSNQLVFYGWCIEIETVEQPYAIHVYKKHIGLSDEFDVEDRTFEKKYALKGVDDSLALQLLDPSLIDAIVQSDVSAVEISDRSVAVFYTLPHIDFTTLDHMLDYGVRMAKQVDANFPKQR